MHLLAYSSYIIFSVFILMHLFMCGGHGKHGEREKTEHMEGMEDAVEEGTTMGSISTMRRSRKKPQNAGGQENTHQHEHSRENFK